MSNPAALEHQYMFDNEAEPEMSDEPTDDFFEKFLETASLRAIGIDPDKLQRETQSIDSRATGIYRKIAAAATPKATSTALAKNAPSTSQKVARTEITK